MTNWIQWDIDDEHGENPLGKPGSFEFNVEFDYDPGEPSDTYFAEQPNATITGAECKILQLEAAPKRQPTKDEIKMLEKWFLSLISIDGKLCQQIEQCGLDQMCVEPDYDDWDD